jgi:hypothetical protein
MGEGMKRAIVGTLKLLAASSGPGSILYAIHLFEKHFELGSRSADATHTVLVNNHGALRYITEAQDNEFRVFLGVGIVLSLGMFVAVAVTKRRD